MIDLILDFIFNNLFIVIIIIAIVSNLFSGSKKSRKRNENRETNPSGDSEGPESLEAKIERNLKKFENIFEQEEVAQEKVPKTQPVKKTMSSIEIQRMKQQEALANRFQTVTDFTKDSNKEMSTILPTVIKHNRKKSSVNKKNLKKRISYSGLQESIVMAEVLGKPRSLKPYNPQRRD